MNPRTKTDWHAYALKERMEDVEERVKREYRKDKALLIARHLETKAKLENHGILLGAGIAVFVNLIWQAFGGFIEERALVDPGTNQQTMYLLQVFMLVMNLICIATTMVIICIVGHFKRLRRQAWYFEEVAMRKLGIDI